MRKLHSKQDVKKNNRTKQFLVGGVLVFLMVISTLGFAFNGSDTKGVERVKYNGLEFLTQNGYWFLTFEGVELIFKFHPKQTDELNIPKIGVDSLVAPISNYYNQPLYIFSENSEAELEISQNLQFFVQRIRPACLEGEECMSDTLPTRTCQDNFIIIREGESNKITQKERCVFIESSLDNLTMASDEFLYRIIGIK